jgi:hypothetical protein
MAWLAMRVVSRRRIPASATLSPPQIIAPAISTLGTRASHNNAVPPSAEVSLNVVTPPPCHDHARDCTDEKFLHPSSSFLRRLKQLTR